MTPCQVGVTALCSGDFSMPCGRTFGHHTMLPALHAVSPHGAAYGPMGDPPGIYKEDIGGHIGAISSPRHFCLDDSLENYVSPQGTSLLYMFFSALLLSHGAGEL